MQRIRVWAGSPVPDMSLLTPDTGCVLYDGIAPSSDRRAHVSAENASDDTPAERQRAAWMAAAQAGDRVAYERVLADSVALIRNVARHHRVPVDALDD